MTKPFRATRIAARSALATEIVPYRDSASSQVSTVPGTPTERPLKRASLKGSDDEHNHERTERAAAHGFPFGVAGPTLLAAGQQGAARG
jgi:hypothetical protein